MVCVKAVKGIVLNGYYKSKRSEIPTTRGNKVKKCRPLEADKSGVDIMHLLCWVADLLVGCTLCAWNSKIRISSRVVDQVKRHYSTFKMS